MLTKLLQSGEKLQLIMFKALKVTLLIEKFDFYSYIRAKYLYAAQFLVSQILPTIAPVWNFSYVQILSLICCLFYFFSTRTLLLGCTGIFGMAFAILECVPFMLLGRYHKSQKFVNKSPKNTKRSYGLDSSILIGKVNRQLLELLFKFYEKK